MDEVAEFHKELSRRIEKLETTELKLAQDAGLPRDAVRDILRGKANDPGVFKVLAIARQLGCTIDDLLRVRKSRQRHIGNTSDSLPSISGTLTDGLLEIAGAEFASIGRYDASLSAGPGSLIDPHAEPLGFYLVERNWLQMITGAAPEHLALVRVDGDSMEKTLFDGDWVMIDRSQTRVSRQGIYAMRVGDDAWIKRIMVDLSSSKVRIISDNQVWPEQILPADEIDIIGRFIALVWRKSVA